MRIQEYITKNGSTKHRPILTLEEAEELQFDNEMQGFCLACGETQSPVEPDAERYACESCGERFVFGMEQLILRGIARIE